MKYMGSKNRISKEILPIILKHIEKCEYYIEPFVGGGNMIDKIPDNIKKIGLDYNKYSIQALNTIKNNFSEIPKNKYEFTEDDYKKIRNDKNNKLYGYVSFALSYGGKFWGGWRRDKTGKRDYVAESYRNALKQSKKIQNVDFIHSSYLNFNYPNNSSIIYCDPPYKGTTKYRNSFNHKEFWEWCRKMSKKHYVYISEYNAPDDFICIWQKEQVSSLTKNTGNKRAIEKLFVHNSQILPF